jgi:hypothetical protein
VEVEIGEEGLEVESVEEPVELREAGGRRSARVVWSDGTCQVARYRVEHRILPRAEEMLARTMTFPNVPVPSTL